MRQCDARLVVACGALLVSAALSTGAVWVGQSASGWNTAANWDPADVPNTAAETAVFSSGQGASPVNVPSVTIGAMTIQDAGFTVNVPNFNTLRLAGTMGLSNDGTLVIGSSASCDLFSPAVLRFDVDSVITGTGAILMNMCPTLSTLGSAKVTHSNGHLIHGRGEISARLDNQGIIDADGAGILDLTGSIKTNTNIIKGSNGSELRIECTITNAGGTVFADGGVIRLINATLVNGTIDRTPTSNSHVYLQSTTTNGTNTLTDLTLMRDAVLEIRGKTTLSGSYIQNRGRIIVNSPANCGSANTLAVASNLSLFGGGEVTMNGGGTCAQLLTEPGVALFHGADHAIQGRGNIEAVLNNAGTIEATVSGQLLRLMTNAKESSGVLRASGGGILSVEVPISGSGGQWQADGGKLQIGSVAVTTTGPISVTHGGELEINGGAMNGSDLVMDDTGTLDINSSVALSGSLTFEMTSESLWSWAADSVLKMTGGTGANQQDFTPWAALEIGGSDLGTDPLTHSGAAAGFSGNFDLAELVIAEDAHLYLRDVKDNGNRGGPLGQSEALYVDTVTFSDLAGRLNLNGLHLYYKTLNGSPSQIIDVPVPPCLSVVPADFDHDCDVDGDDFDKIVACTLGAAVPYDPLNLPSGCTFTPSGGLIAPDLDADGDVDMDDFSIFQRCFSGAGKPADPSCAE